MKITAIEIDGVRFKAVKAKCGFECITCDLLELCTRVFLGMCTEYVDDRMNFKRVEE